MPSLPFTDQQCFFIVMLAFVVIGFQRGWRREVITLVSVLLAFFLIHPDSGRNFTLFFVRLPGTITYLLTGVPQRIPPADTTPTFLGPWGSLVLFFGIIALGYYIGQKAFPGKASALPVHERLIGIVPAVISGAFVLYYLSNNFFPKDQAGQSLFTVAVQPPDPTNYIAIIFAIALLAVVVALIARRRAAKK